MIWPDFEHLKHTFSETSENIWRHSPYFLDLGQGSIPDTWQILMITKLRPCYLAIFLHLLLYLVDIDMTGEINYSDSYEDFLSRSTIDWLFYLGPQNLLPQSIQAAGKLLLCLQLHHEVVGDRVDLSLHMVLGLQRKILLEEPSPSSSIFLRDTPGSHPGTRYSFCTRKLMRIDQAYSILVRSN